MTLFLPYHETPHFAKITSILHVKWVQRSVLLGAVCDLASRASRLWSFLSPLKASGKPLPRSILVDEMLVNVDLARFVTGILPDSLAVGRVYRTLISFTVGVTVEYLTRMRKIEEAVIAYMLPALIRSFASDSNGDCAVSSSYLD